MWLVHVQGHVCKCVCSVLFRSLLHSFTRTLVYSFTYHLSRRRHVASSSDRTLAENLDPHSDPDSDRTAYRLHAASGNASDGPPGALAKNHDLPLGFQHPNGVGKLDALNLRGRAVGEVAVQFTVP